MWVGIPIIFTGFSLGSFIRGDFQRNFNKFPPLEQGVRGNLGS
jgi:hypothetical protein